MNTAQINNRDFARQLKIFKNLRWDNISPTDIDGFIEFNNEIFIIFELKYGDTEMKYGQQLALERLKDAIHESGKSVLLIIASHNSKENEDIDASACVVSKYRSNKSWHQPNHDMTVKDICDLFLSLKASA